MKKLQSLKLNRLSNAELEKREMNNITGGACACACAGPSPSSSNDSENTKYDYSGSGDGNGNCECKCSDIIPGLDTDVASRW